MGGQRKKTQQESDADEIVKMKILSLNRLGGWDSTEESEAESEYSEDEVSQHTYSVRMAPPSSHGKRKRGVVKGYKTVETVFRTGQRIKVNYNEATGFPSNKETWSGLARDLGAAIRDHVPMIKPSWTELDVIHKMKAFAPLLVHYELAIDECPGLFNLLDETAYNVYKRWKSTLHKRWKSMNGALPNEFRHRKDQWEYLGEHFKSDKFLRRSVANTANREKPRLNHHAGSRPFVYYTEEHKKEGCRTPYINTFGDVYVRPGNTEAQTQFENMQKLAAEYTKKNLLPSAEPNTPIENLPALPAQAEIDIYGKTIGTRKGKEIRGLGRAGVRDLRREPTLASQRPSEEQQEQSELHAKTAELQKQLEAHGAALQSLRDQVAIFMSQMAAQQGSESSVTQQLHRNDALEGGNGDSSLGSS